MLGIAQQIQATPYSNYDEDLAVEWTNLQERCGVNYPTGVQLLQTNVTDPPGYVTNYTTATYCLSGNTYTVVSGDSCGAIAAAQGVATGSLITLNNVLPDCTNLQVGQSLCIPQTCTTYIVQSGDTCFAIATAHNITFTQLRSYNPTINPTCTNLIAGNNICLTLPGGEVYNGTTIAGATPTQTGSYATATVTPPGSVAYGTLFPLCNSPEQYADIGQAPQPTAGNIIKS
jgi:LysM repeat protein